MYSNVNDVSILSDIVAKVEKERDDYEEYHRKLKQWEASRRKVHSDTPLFQISDGMQAAVGARPARASAPQH